MAVPSVEKLLLEHGPCLTSRLCKILEEKGLSSVAARQQVSRAKGKVKRLDGLVFPHRVRFAYHESHFNSHKYWEALLKTLSDAGSAYAPAIHALLNRGSIVPLSQFDIVSGSPILQKGQVSSQTVLQRLTHIRVLKQVEIEGIGSCIRLNERISGESVKLHWLRSRLLTENILLLAVKDWAKKLGMASYDRIQVRGEASANPRVGTFAWDLAGPCYLSPLVRYDKSGKPQPGFLICDVIVAGEPIGRGAVEAFVRKVQMLKQLKNIAPVLPVMIADQYDGEAFKFGRSRGIIMGTPGTLFGRDVARGLDVLLKVLSNAAAVAATKPEAVIEIFDKLAAIEGAAMNLRGPLFEMIVGHCVKKNDDGSIDIGVVVTNPANGHKAEIDVLRTRENQEVWCYECKGYHAGNRIKLTEVEKWLKKVPEIYAYMKQHDYYGNSKIHFEFWTTSSFEDDSLARLQAASEKTKKYSIGWKDGKAVRQYAAQVKTKSMVATLDEHYFNHPLTKFDKKHNTDTALSNIIFDDEIVTTGDEFDFDLMIEEIAED